VKRLYDNQGAGRGYSGRAERLASIQAEKRWRRLAA